MSAFSALNFKTARTTPPGRVTQAIATASRRTGVDFGYLMGQAKIESAMNPTARANTSSATGLYQFLDQSWLAVINNHGANYGMDWAANAIQKTQNGRYYVADPQVRQQILDLRNHPETASVMAAELASDNRDYLQQRTGKQAEPVDLYLAHFLGAGGAAKFLTAMNNAPNTAAAALFPAAARTNASVFYDRQGNARSLADIRSTLAQRLSGAQNSAMQSGTIDDSANFSLPPGANTVQPADYLRIARAQIAQQQGLTDGDALTGSQADMPGSMNMIDPATPGAGAEADNSDANLMRDLQSLTLGRSFGPTSAGAVAPRAETARLAYLMLATFGR